MLVLFYHGVYLSFISAKTNVSILLKKLKQRTGDEISSVVTFCVLHCSQKEKYSAP